MIFHPAILALLLGSLLTVLMLCYSAYQGLLIIQNWDIKSGSEQQLNFEKKTYLISTIMAYAMGFEVLSLFLLIYTADSLSSLFVGAMCAAGSLNVNAYGYPTLMLKILNCLLAGLWLIVNYTDNKAYDYPLIKVKYRMLLIISPFLLVESLVQGAYLLQLKPDIITSCCSILFSRDNTTVITSLFIPPVQAAGPVFLVSFFITLIIGLGVVLTEKGAIAFAVASFFHFLISIVALISFVSIYIYELPTHHCPFCILHQEYHFIGYALYTTILVGTIAGIGAGIIQPFRKIDKSGRVNYDA